MTGPDATPPQDTDADPCLPEFLSDGLTCSLSDDGLRLSFRYEGPEGTVSSSVSWTDPDVALSNYAAAVRAFESRLPGLVARLKADGASANSRLFRLGAFTVAFGSGCDKVLVPRIKLGRWSVSVAWLDLGASIRR